MWEVRAGCEACGMERGQAAVPVGDVRARACTHTKPCPEAAVGPARPGRTTNRRAQPPISTPGPTGVEGAGGTEGPGRGAGRRQRRLTDNTLTTSPDRLEAAARPAGPGRASSRRAERSSRRGRRAGGQAARRPEICRGNKQQKRAGRRPPAHTAAGPHKAARPHSRGLRHPEHQQHHVVEMGGIEPPSQRGARNTSGTTITARILARHSKRGRHQPTPCASALTHP